MSRPMLALAGVAMLAGCSQAPAHKIPAAVGAPPSPAAAGPHLVEVDGPAPNSGEGVAGSSASTSTSLAAEATVPTAVTEAGPGTTSSPGVGSQVIDQPAPVSVATSPELPGQVDTGAPAGELTTVSWYGAESGATTATGEAFDPAALTFAHRSMTFGAVVEFRLGAAVVVAQCNDRGPWVAGRDFDLSRGAFAWLAPLSAGVLEVSWRRVA